MKVKCPGCGGIFQLKPEMAGKKVKCRCSHVFQTAAASAPKPPPRPAPKQVASLLQETSRGVKQPPERKAMKVYTTSVLSKLISVAIVGFIGTMFLFGSVSVFFLLDANYQFKGRNLLVTIGLMLLVALWLITIAIDRALYRVVVSQSSIEVKSLLRNHRIAISEIAYVECNNGLVFRFRDRDDEVLGVVTSFFRGFKEFDSWVKKRFDCSVYGLQY